MPTSELPAARSRFGASMGRPSTVVPFTTWAGRVSLRRVHLNSQGYDSGGAYWGHGAALYRASSDDGAVDVFFRAADRDAAKAHVQTLAPHAWFYR